MMKAIVVRDKWVKDLSELANCIEELPIPVLREDHVLVEVKAIGTNFFDILLVQGKYQHRPTFPFTPGAEFSGVIKQVHESVKNFKVGDKVFGAVNIGAYASCVAVKQSNLLHIPHGLTFEQAAGIFITYPTSYAAITVRAKLQAGETILVHAAAGGVGLAAVQIAKALGATVIATASTEEKLQICRKNGADYVINYKTQDWVKVVQKITNNKGVDVVYDPVGLLEMSMKVAAWDARLIVIGFASHPPGISETISTNRILLKNISVIGLFWGAYQSNDPATVTKVWTELLQLLISGKLRPVVYGETFRGLERLPYALKALGGRKSYGKVVVTMEGEKAKL